MSRVPRLLRSFLLYLAIFLVSLAGAVVAAEWYLSARASRPLIPFYNRLYPYVMFRPQEAAEYVTAETYPMSRHKSRVFHYTNEDGFRVSRMGYPLPKEKPAGQLRIAVLGSSAVQLASTYETTLPGSLKTYLQTVYPGRDIEVINAGITSCVSRQSLVHFLLTVADYHPDVVILYDGVNDIGLPLVYEARHNFPYNFQTLEAAWEEYRARRQDSLFRVMLRRSELYRALRFRFRRESADGLKVLPAAQIARDQAFVTAHISGYLSNWVKLIELSRAYRFEPVLVLQPTGGLEPEYAVPQNMEFFHLDRKTALEWNDAFNALYGEAYRQIDELRRKYPAVTFLEWSRFLRPAKDYFWDSVHVYDDVNLLLAKKITSEIKPRLDGFWQSPGTPLQ